MPDPVPGVVAQGERQGKLCRVDKRRPQAEGFDQLQVVSEVARKDQGAQAKE